LANTVANTAGQAANRAQTYFNSTIKQKVCFYGIKDFVFGKKAVI